MLPPLFLQAGAESESSHVVLRPTIPNKGSPSRYMLYESGNIQDLIFHAILDSARFYSCRESSCWPSWAQESHCLELRYKFTTGRLPPFLTRNTSPSPINDIPPPLPRLLFSYPIPAMPFLTKAFGPCPPIITRHPDQETNHAIWLVVWRLPGSPPGDHAWGIVWPVSTSTTGYAWVCLYFFERLGS